jgi:hypothetical protein
LPVIGKVVFLLTSWPVFLVVTFALYFTSSTCWAR